MSSRNALYSAPGKKKNLRSEECSSERSEACGQKLCSGHSSGHISAQGLRHSCKWPPGSQIVRAPRSVEDKYACENHVLRVCGPAREPRTGKSPKVLPECSRECSQKLGVLSGVLPKVLSRVLSRVLFLLFSTPKATWRALSGALPRASPISESTLESTLGALSEISLLSAP